VCLAQVGMPKGTAEWWSLANMERVGELRPRLQQLLEVQVTRVAWAPDATAIGARAHRRLLPTAHCPLPSGMGTFSVALKFPIGTGCCRCAAGLRRPGRSPGPGAPPAPHHRP
jgi:hypothetical protein